MRKSLPLCLWIFLAASLEANAQQPVKLHLDDGSILRCSLVASSIPVELYGATINVPITDIQRIRFGHHSTPAEQASLSAATRSLGSAIHKEREVASRALRELGRLSIPMLRKASTGSDAEVKKRAVDLLAEIAEADPREVHEFDLLTLRRFAIEGKIKTETLAFKSATLGDFSVALGKIESLLVLGSTDAMLTVDAAKYGDAWMRTEIQVNAGDSLNIKATGQVELWPQVPGQYTAFPNGHVTTGKGGQYQAGALIGRIGATGPSFLIGEVASVTARESGELHLHIVMSPWNNQSSGNYAVTVKTGR